MSWPSTDFEVEIQQRLDEQDETIVTLTAALAARDEALGKIANYPGTHDIDCGEEDGDDDGECCTLAWMKSHARAALTTPAPTKPQKKNRPCRDRQYRPSPADEHAHRNSHEQLLCDTCRNAPDTTAIYVVFDGPPGATPGRFVDTENDRGESVRAGGWIDRGDGTWALRIPAPADGEKGGG